MILDALEALVEHLKLEADVQMIIVKTNLKLLTYFINYP